MKSTDFQGNITMPIHFDAYLVCTFDLDEVTNLQCDYLETVEKCEHLEKELSKSRTMSKSFEALQKHAINLELDLQQCKEKIKNDKSFKENQSNVFLKEREQYFEIQDLKAQLQDKGIAISMVMASSSISFKLRNIKLAFERYYCEWPSKAFEIPSKYLCSLVELGEKPKRKCLFTLRTTPELKKHSGLQLLHMDLCGPMQMKHLEFSLISSHLSKEDFMLMLQQFELKKARKFLNKTLHAYFAKEGIRHETSTARTPEQNGVVERRNRTLVEAARTMLSAAKVPLFFWAEAIATTCFTQNRSLVIPRHEKTPYHIINARKPSVKFFHIFGSLCYIVRDGENLDKMKEKGDACIFVGYSTQSKAYRVFNKRKMIIVKTIHVNFDELPHMASYHVSSDAGPQCSTTVLEQDSLSPGPQSQENVPQVAETVTTSNELELLYSPMFSELLNGTSPVVSKSSAVHAADNTDKR
ncbi:retrovirus-related pol polyprotein from transposon TNT 1-94 [Tanacetum coccineum]